MFHYQYVNLKKIEIKRYSKCVSSVLYEMTFTEKTYKISILCGLIQASMVFSLKNLVTSQARNKKINKKRKGKKRQKRTLEFHEMQMVKIKSPKFPTLALL